MRRASKSKKQAWPFHSENSPITLALIHVDAILERIRLRKLKTFDASLVSELCKLQPAEIKELNHQYDRTFEDFKAALAGDSFCIEAYSNYDKGQMKLALALLKAVRALKHDKKANGKLRIRNHGPRKHKQKPPEQIVKKVLFMERDPETGVSSLKPTELVGASEMWIFNTKTRKLGCYYASNGIGLSAKGTTVLQYDETKSTTKTIRKPKEQVHEFISKSPSEMHKYWDSIRAVPQPISPRLSRDTLILRAIQTA